MSFFKKNAKNGDNVGNNSCAQGDCPRVHLFY